MILIVEPDPAQRRLIADALGRAGLAHEAFASAAEAAPRLARRPPDAPTLAALDIDLPGEEALALVRRVRADRPDLPILALSARASVARAVAAMRAGADDVLLTPLAPDRLERAVREALARAQAAARPARARTPAPPADPFAALVAAAPASRAAVALARQAAQAEIPVLFEGESGVGKEVFARALHAASRRAAGPFVAVNCGALPEGLVESILFGHEKGAFTGATERRAGRFAEAEGGVLFLDEVGELPLAAQVKLLRALQEREIDPVGAARPRAVDIRVLAATNRDLRGEVAGGRFREDLYWRLAAFPVRLPPLRARRADIPLLARQLLARLAAAEGRAPPALSPEAAARLAAADWPGNVRELENALHRAMVLAGEGPLEAAHFDALAAADAPAGAAPSPSSPETAPAAPPGVGPDGHILSLAAVEAEHIRRALSLYDGRMAEAARRLGVGRSTLYRRLAELGLAPPAAR